MNQWQAADMVFLFDEFYIPRRATIAYAQGLQDHEATEGPLATMRTQNSKSEAVDRLFKGNTSYASANRWP